MPARKSLTGANSVVLNPDWVLIRATGWSLVVERNAHWVPVASKTKGAHLSYLPSDFPSRNISLVGLK